VNLQTYRLNIMDRRTKIILLSIGSALLLAAVIWFFIWPLLKPVLPTIKKSQPPAIAQPNAQNPQISNVPTDQTPVAPTFTFDPSDYPDIEQIAALNRRAGVFSETIESGSSEKEFDNITGSAYGASSKFVTFLGERRAQMRAAHPVDGPTYLTIARRLVEIPESEMVISGDTFVVRVQMQVRVKDGDTSTVEYREATVTFTNTDEGWLLSRYEVKPYTP
jgi:hypothetical protein